MMDVAVHAQQCEFSIGSIRIAAERWGQSGSVKVIALHGWLDNAASFSFLAPYLENIDLVAIDLPGHGRSSRRGESGTYNIWQDLQEVKGVADALGWQRFSLLGHSRGAMIASLFTGAFPDRVERAFLIDAITPYTTIETDLPGHLAASISQSLNPAYRPKSFYGSYVEAVSARSNGMFPITNSAAEALARRGVKKDGNGFYWDYDPKLLSPSEVRFSPEQTRAFVERFRCKVHVVAASDGLLNDHLASAENAWLLAHPMIEIIDMSGSHHIQLSESCETIALLASHINAYFLS